MRHRTKITGTLRLGGHDWPFELYRQDVDLGAAGIVDYFYMQPTDFRGKGPERELSNFRSCIGYSLARAQQAGLGDDLNEQRNFVSAVAYGLVNRSKGQQESYLDAFPKPGTIRAGEPVLPEDDRQRIRRVIESRDRTHVKQELDAALGAYQPSRGDLLGLEQAFAQWVDKGVNWLRLEREDGVAKWLHEVGYWLAKYRKRSPPRVRAFINYFAYQAKTSFYLCYANSWVGIIAWLREHHGLNELSERFLKVWHCQNQPIAIPPGRTAGGLYYPTHCRATLLVPEPRRAGTPRQLIWESPRIGPEYIPDVFSGHVLALHPLTWYLFADPALRELAGRYFASPECETVANYERASNCTNYWGLIEAILVAARKYRIARDQHRDRRGARIDDGQASSAAQADAPPLNSHATIDDFARSRGWKCHCGAEYRCRKIEPPDQAGEACRVLLKCADQGHSTSRKITSDQLGAFLGIDL